MKWELYLSRQEWEEVKRAVRERATPPGEKKPRCEVCGAVHGRLKRNREGYLVPMWLHTPHKEGAPLMSKNPEDYLCLCPRCHMAFDRSMKLSRYREGYAVTTTDVLVGALRGVGFDLWGVVGQGWYWRMDGMEGGPEESPALAVAAAIVRMSRLFHHDEMTGSQDEERER